jgi:hypothetical protein
MGKTALTNAEYVKLMEQCLDAWNTSDPALVASFYADDLDYRDPTVPEGIFRKDAFIDYLKLIFKVWPEQQWTPLQVMPHAETGDFSIEYEFRIAREGKEIRGRGMDRMEFRDDKISLNHVYLNADKWKDWIRDELKSPA